MEEIKLNDFLRIPEEELSKYKLHLANFNGETQPLDVFASSWDEWMGWNRWRGNRNDWNREYIFSLIADYRRPNKYIFGGIFKVISREGEEYEIELSEQFRPLIGRLVVDFYRYQGLRGRAFCLEGYMDSFRLHEITQNPYSGEPFCGYENIRLDFTALEVIVRNQKADWQTALSHMKGIYLIADKSNGKQYVGSAYGEGGVWSRWSQYVGSGHGGNDELVSIIQENGMDYARRNFQFSLIEAIPMPTDNDTVIRRESHWKDILLTRQYGYNNN